MPALTADRLTKKRSGVDLDLAAAANAVLYMGGIVCITTTGVAVRGSATAALKTVGICKARVDNTGGSDGAVRVRVERGTWQFNNSAAGDQLTQADIGSTCYVVDDNTVAKTNGSGTRPAAGTVRDVDANGVWVNFA